MGRASDIFRKIMLGILLLIMSAALLLTAVNGITQHSYLIALLAGRCVGVYPVPPVHTRKARLLASIDTRKTTLLPTLLCAAVNLAWVLAVRIEPFSDYETSGRQPARWLPAERLTPRGTLPCTRTSSAVQHFSAPF